MRRGFPTPPPAGVFLPSLPVIFPQTPCPRQQKPAEKISASIPFFSRPRPFPLYILRSLPIQQNSTRLPAALRITNPQIASEALRLSAPFQVAPVNHPQQIGPILKRSSLEETPCSAAECAESLDNMSARAGRVSLPVRTARGTIAASLSGIFRNTGASFSMGRKAMYAEKPSTSQ